MIEARIIEYLETALNVPVYAEVPATGSGQYLVIEKTGATRENLLDEADIAVQAYADTLYDAATLNERVKTAMFAMNHEPNISGVQLNSDYNFTDTSTKRYRYQAIFVVAYY